MGQPGQSSTAVETGGDADAPEREADVFEVAEVVQVPAKSPGNNVVIVLPGGAKMSLDEFLKKADDKTLSDLAVQTRSELAARQTKPLYSKDDEEIIRRHRVAAWFGYYLGAFIGPFGYRPSEMTLRLAKFAERHSRTF